eukprot:TRINITY_DN617_c0_g1_i3.p1 TRINITY_DN617_c0_g1~~TRINITY_DN617_c0_g1_i3.p1  ORF type:complete len:451 (-),score=80.87 TRINITY_DN617_c0_g1_i3:909-2261(-)
MSMSHAVKRLYKDYQELKLENLVGISGQPLKDDLLNWHCNVMGAIGSPLEGTCIHLELWFTQEYPSSAPVLYLYDDVRHPNVFGRQMCLNLLEHQYIGSQLHLGGWSSGYSVMTVLLQVQSFLSDLAYKHQPPKVHYVCQACGHENASPDLYFPPVRLPEKILPVQLSPMEELACELASDIHHVKLHPDSGILDVELAVGREENQVKVQLLIEQLDDDATEHESKEVSFLVQLHPELQNLWLFSRVFVEVQLSNAPLEIKKIIAGLENSIESLHPAEQVQVLLALKAISSHDADSGDEKIDPPFRNMSDVTNKLTFWSDAPSFPLYFMKESHRSVIEATKKSTETGDLSIIGEDSIAQVLSFCSHLEMKTFGQTCSGAWGIYEKMMSRIHQSQDLNCFHFKTSFKEDAIGYGVGSMRTVALLQFLSLLSTQKVSEQACGKKSLGSGSQCM